MTHPPTAVVHFLHGAGDQADHPSSKLLRDHLAKALGGPTAVLAPDLPNPARPHCHEWLAAMADHFARHPRPGPVVAHSLGGSVVLKLLSESPAGIRPASLHVVAAPFWGRGGYDLVEFALRDDFPAGLDPHLPVYLYHSDDDDIVPFDHLQAYRRRLPRAILRPLSGFGHYFVAGAGPLLEDVLRNLRDD